MVEPDFSVREYLREPTGGALGFNPMKIRPTPSDIGFWVKDRIRV